MHSVIPSLVAAALLYPAFGAGAQVAERAASVVVGRITDRSTGRAVAGASVVLEGLDGDRMSDEDGRFEFHSVPAGSYVLRIMRIGYGAVVDTVAVLPTNRLELNIQLVPSAVELEPLVVASYSMGGKMAVFYQRRRTTQAGHFITRAELEEQHRTSVSGMLRLVRGLRVLPTRSGGMGTGNDVVMRGNCKPAIFIDGILTTEVRMSIDEMLQPQDIEGIEIYRGSETPAAFVRNKCGSILFWTRPGGRTTEDGVPLWKRALIGGVIATLVLLFAR